MYEKTTIEECMEKAEKGLTAIINDGKVIGFEQEEIPTQTTNPSGDNE